MTIHSLYNACKLYFEIKFAGFLVDQKSLKVYTLALFYFLPQNIKSAMVDLSKGFPFRDKFREFLAEYANCTTYWYVPKARTLDDKNIEEVRKVLSIIMEEFLDCVWNHQTQDSLLKRLIEKAVLEPYREDSTPTDQTALVRIWKKLLETLGLLWVQDDKEIIITDAGLDVLSKEPRDVIEGQIAKIQYPNPSRTAKYSGDFKGILPHLFLLQVLRECDYKITFYEYELFVNLAQGQEDITQVIKYIKCWRDLDDGEKDTVLSLVKEIPIPVDKMDIEEETENMRYRRIHLNSSYQRSFYTYPSYLDSDSSNSYIVCNNPIQIDELVENKLRDLKVAFFHSLEDWFAYYGDPTKKPSWFNFLCSEVEKVSTDEASKLIEEHKVRLTEEEQKEIKNKQIEKKIEDFYVDCLERLEVGLKLSKNGRQYSTPIGRIDLLCKSEDGKYVVVEIKVDEARDSVFGQILRYIGWVHRNLEGGKDNVRGIILAGKFPESARFSRIGLLREDYKDFIKFKKHGLYVSDT